MIATDERVALFVAAKTGTRIVPPWTAMGIEHEGEIIAGAVFNHFEGADIHATVAGRGWTKSFLADVGQYVFRQLQCERMTVVTEQPRVVRIAQKLGGEVEGLLRNHFGPGRPGFIVGILKEDYPW